MLTVKATNFPFSPQLIVRMFPDKEAEKIEGFGGLVPSSYRCINSLISLRRQLHWALDVMRGPLIGRNGSGSFEFVTKFTFAGTGVHVPVPAFVVMVEVMDDDVGISIGVVERVLESEVEELATVVVEVVRESVEELDIDPGRHCEY